MVHGIGGAGKTQLVLNYVKSHRHDYSAVFWIEARSKESIEQDYVQVYRLLYNINPAVPHSSVQLDDAVPAVKRWFLQRQKKWLFVIDSADNIANEGHSLYINPHTFLPDDPSIHVIITTRDGSAKRMSMLTAVEVGAMEEEEAAALFMKHAETEPRSSQDDEVPRIVQELGFLALAVILAGSYVRTTYRLRRDVSQYLPEYRKRRKELLNPKPNWLVDRYSESVLAIRETTFHALQSRCPGACRLLAVLAFLHGDDIFMVVTAINAGSDLALPWTKAISPQGVDRYGLENLFTELQNLSFVNYSDDQDSYIMHKLVQVWAYDRIDLHEQQQYAHAAALLLQETVNITKAANPLRKDRLVPHPLTSFDRMKAMFEFLSPADDGILI